MSQWVIFPKCIRMVARRIHGLYLGRTFSPTMEYSAALNPISLASSHWGTAGYTARWRNQLGGKCLRDWSFVFITFVFIFYFRFQQRDSRCEQQIKQTSGGWGVYWCFHLAPGMLKGETPEVGHKEASIFHNQNCLYPERHLSHEAFKVRDKSSLSWQQGHLGHVFLYLTEDR